MSDETPPATESAQSQEATPSINPDSICPVCSGPLIAEKCKVVCRSERCRYRIVFNCAEF